MYNQYNKIFQSEIREKHTHKLYTSITNKLIIGNKQCVLIYSEQDTVLDPIGYDKIIEKWIFMLSWKVI